MRYGWWLLFALGGLGLVALGIWWDRWDTRRWERTWQWEWDQPW